MSPLLRYVSVAFKAALALVVYRQDRNDSAEARKGGGVVVSGGGYDLGNSRVENNAIDVNTSGVQHAPMLLYVIELRGVCRYLNLDI